jgi:hypothetical protein
LAVALARFAVSSARALSATLIEEVGKRVTSQPFGGLFGASAGFRPFLAHGPANRKRLRVEFKIPNKTLFDKSPRPLTAPRTAEQATKLWRAIGLQRLDWRLRLCFIQGVSEKCWHRYQKSGGLEFNGCFKSGTSSLKRYNKPATTIRS